MKDIAHSLLFIHPDLANKREGGINERRSVMHEVHAALAVIALRREFGGPDRPTEDEFYARYSEVPWRRLARFSRVVLGMMKPRLKENSASGASQHVCSLSKA
jgi:hypothetical protein